MQQINQEELAIASTITTQQLIERQRNIIYKFQEKEIIKAEELTDSFVQSEDEKQLLKIWREINCLHKLVKIESLEKAISIAGDACNK